MSLVLQAIARHDGVMRVESEAGHGTTVMIWLPANSTSEA
jgi:signal transduction histidine kinase